MTHKIPAPMAMIIAAVTLGAQQAPAPAITPPAISTPAGAAAVEQRMPGTRAAATLAVSFDGLGVGFTGPQGTASVRQPSDNSLAVGPDHIVQTVNSRMAIFAKRGSRFDTTGRVLYGPVATNNVFRGFGGTCEARNNGDAVVRYDQLAHRWLIVMPIFRRAAARPDQPGVPDARTGRVGVEPGVPDARTGRVGVEPDGWSASERAYISPPGRSGQPGPAVALFQPERPPDEGQSPAPSPQPRPDPNATGPYSMCYAISTGADPFGPYHRYEFLRPLFPDYPRPAVWPDGYYVPTSTGDDVIQKHTCIVDRAKMLKGEPATEQCLIVDGVNFLNNADLDGTQLPPAGAPNVMMASGGTQLKGVYEDERILAWNVHVDWRDPNKTRLVGPTPVRVAPYRYLCDGQLTHCVPQPGTDRRLDAQGDKIMARLVYRRIGARESIVGVHSVNTSTGGGGVRWYELRIGPPDGSGNDCTSSDEPSGGPGAQSAQSRDCRRVTLHQQGTYAPDAAFRWMASPAIDRLGNIGIGYSFGSSSEYAGQRFAARLADDPPGVLTLREHVLVEGEDAQTPMRWEDYTQTAIDPSDDCTIWYVGDYIKKGAASYSTRIGAYRLPGCAGS